MINKNYLDTNERTIPTKINLLIEKIIYQRIKITFPACWFSRTMIGRNHQEILVPVSALSENNIHTKLPPTDSLHTDINHEIPRIFLETSRHPIYTVTPSPFTTRTMSLCRLANIRKELSWMEYLHYSLPAVSLVSLDLSVFWHSHAHNGNPFTASHQTRKVGPFGGNDHFRVKYAVP